MIDSARLGCSVNRWSIKRRVRISSSIAMGSKNALFVIERYFLAWFLFAGSGGFSNIAEASSWDRESVEVREGEDLTLRCRVEGLGALDVVRVTHISNKQSMAVTDNSNVKHPFTKLLRYKVHYESNGTVGTVNMHYRGIQGSDSGSLGCYKLSGEQNMAVVNIQVLVPVQEVHAISISESGLERRVDDKTAEITLQDDRIVGVGCVASVNGSLTAPELEIAIGDEDKTDDSVAKETVTSYSSENDLTVYSSEQKLTMIFDKVDRAHSRKMLKCTAKVKGYEEKTKAVLIKVRYAPIIACTETYYYLRVGASVTFSCNVQSNPNSQIRWQIGDSDKPGNTVVKEKALDEDRIQVNMTILEITTSHFSTYTFTASNDINIATEMIILEEDKTVDDEITEGFPEIEEEVVVKNWVETELTAPAAEVDKLENDSNQETETPEIVLVNHQKNSEAILGPDQSHSLVDRSSASMIRFIRFPAALVLPIITRWL